EVVANARPGEDATAVGPLPIKRDRTRRYVRPSPEREVEPRHEVPYARTRQGAGQRPTVTGDVVHPGGRDAGSEFLPHFAPRVEHSMHLFRTEHPRMHACKGRADRKPALPGVGAKSGDRARIAGLTPPSPVLPKRLDRVCEVGVLAKIGEDLIDIFL